MTKDLFSVGEIAIILPCGKWGEYDNTECTITHRADRYDIDDKYGKTRIYGYVVRCALDGDELIVEPWFLRKRHLPDKESEMPRMESLHV
jgi:hypothetical protein